ncbi:MAG TPA: hypothetical protein VK601_21480, partial [Kofleriaceae bacterium]|nr:hypothetical protein [Kofleriaceae bacterium]
MIASWRGLAVTAALAVALAVIAIVDIARAPGGPGARDRALMPGFDPARATELVWERAGQPAIRAVRVGERWELRVPAAVPADPDAIGDVLAALRGARWHRRGESPAPHATLTAVIGGERRVLGIAGPIAGTEQVWIAVDGRGAVVDGWVARALDRDRLALQIRRPLADAAGARSIAITGAVTGAVTSGAPIDLQLEGNPRRLVRPAALLVAPELAGELERALREVTIVRLPDGPLAAAGLAIRITVAGAAAAEVAVAIGGGCPGAPALVALSGGAGDGCIEPAALAAIADAAARLHQPPGAIAERRPVPFEPRRIALADGVELATSPPRVGGAEADPARVAELLAALAAPAEVVALPAGPPAAHLVATDRNGAAIALDVFAGGAVVRRGEPIALRPAPGAARLLVRPSRELRDLTLWVE